MFRSHKAKVQLLVGLLFIFLLFSSFSVFRNWQFNKEISSNSYAGVVIGKTAEFLIIQDIRGNSKTFLIKDETEIRNGRVKIPFNDISTGTRVFVEFSEMNQDIYTAVRLGIINPARKPFK